MRGVERYRNKITIQSQDGVLGPLLSLALVAGVAYTLLTQPDLHVTSVVAIMVCVLYAWGIVKLIVQRNSRITFHLGERKVTRNGKVLCSFDGIEAIYLDSQQYENDQFDTYFLEVRIRGRGSLELLSGQEMGIHVLARELSEWTGKELHRGPRY